MEKKKWLLLLLTLFLIILLIALILLLIIFHTHPNLIQGGGGDGSFTCPENYINCGNSCIDTSNDEEHCGACFNVCNPGEFCIEGTCTCPNGYEICNLMCVDTSSDPENCGSCGNICTQDEYCCGGICTTIDSDNCGSCGDICSPQFPTCCDQECVNTDYNFKHCGACGNACDFNEVCCDGVCIEAQGECGGCGIFCQQNETCCEGNCVDLDWNNNYCGSCANSCGPFEDCCDGVCVNVYGDENNCGTCFNSCEQGETCCDGQCADLDSNPQHCGACNFPCNVLSTCIEGQCEQVIGSGDPPQYMWYGSTPGSEAQKTNQFLAGHIMFAINQNSTFKYFGDIPASPQHPEFAVSNDHYIVEVLVSPASTLTVYVKYDYVDEVTQTVVYDAIESFTFLANNAIGLYQTDRKALRYLGLYSDASGTQKMIESDWDGMEFKCGCVGYIDMHNRNFALLGYRTEFHNASGGEKVDLNFIIYKVRNLGGKKFTIDYVEDIYLKQKPTGQSEFHIIKEPIKLIQEETNNQITDYFDTVPAPANSFIYDGDLSSNKGSIWANQQLFNFKREFPNPIVVNGSNHEGIILRIQSANSFGSSQGADYVNTRIEYVFVP